MRAIIALALGSLGVSMVYAGVSGSGLKLFAGFFGKSVTPPADASLTGGLNGFTPTQTGQPPTTFQTPGGPLGGLLPGTP